MRRDREPAAAAYAPMPQLELVEGVSWLSPDLVVMVSDKAKPEQDSRCRAKDQSIHVFRVPAP